MIDDHVAKCLQMLYAAENYSKSALVLSATRDRQVLMPSTIMAAFSLELHFKCLYFSINKKDFKVKTGNVERHSHDFSLLFATLDSKIRKQMEITFKSSFVPQDFNQHQDLERVSGKKISTELQDTIAAWSNVFEKWRYTYDMSNGGPRIKSALFFHAIEAAIREAIFTALPELLIAMHSHHPDKSTIVGRSK